MGIVTTLEGRCRKCYSCVRNCPTRAIKVENEQAKVLDDLCIACGYCLKACAQKAKYVERQIDLVRRFLQESRTVACIAPSFPAEFDYVAPGQVFTGLRRLGFTYVYEVAYGAYLVTQEYVRFLSSGGKKRGLLSTPCSAIIHLVEKRYPSLVDRLVPVVSPMVATGRAAKTQLGKDCRTVFIGPCAAKKLEARDEAVRDAIDAVITFRELRVMLEESEIRLRDLAESPADSPFPSLGLVYPVTGGLLRSAGLLEDFLENDFLTVQGKDACLEVLEGLREDRIEPAFVDILFCQGCINGPFMENELAVHARQKLVVGNYRSRLTREGEGRIPVPEIEMRRTFRDKSLSLPVPSAGEIEAILRELEKTKPEDELNCGACGYGSCREKAVAVYQGLAENKMCLPYLITQLERNNEELRYLKDYNENVVESIAEGIVVVNDSLVITTFSDAPGKLTDQPRRTIIGRNLYQALPALDTPEVREVLSSVIAGGAHTEVTDFRYRTKSGQLIINIKAYPLKDESRGPYGAIVVCEDITEKRRWEAQLAQADKLASIGRLAAGVAHEINTPLNLIAGYTELLREQMKDDPDRLKPLQIVAEEVDRIAQIVRNLLSFARPAPAAMQRCRVDDIVRHVLGLVERQFQFRGIEVLTEFGPAVPEVLGDPAELEQVFLNIAINAAQAMPEGGKFFIRTEVFRTGGDSVVKAEFTDTGHGIPRDDLGKIFEPFFTTKGVGQGTGLGLSVSYGIIKKYNGTIEVSSEVGKGTTFVVSLPAAE